MRELTLRARDAISSLGERLSAPLVAAALASRGIEAEAIEATELVVTDSNHGAAEPQMETTRQRLRSPLRPLLQRGIVPVVTGCLGATAEGVLTTLGRGGSDYSATILGAALEADEVIIWTDVDGVLTADPRLVSGANTIPEISYSEAAELAFFGAKVLHQKALRPLMRSEIPVWICNTFAPERRGTKITPSGSQNSGGVKARNCDQRRRHDHRRRSRHHGGSGPVGAHLHDDRCSSSRRAANFTILVAKQRLLRRSRCTRSSAPLRRCDANSRRIWRTKKLNISP